MVVWYDGDWIGRMLDKKRDVQKSKVFVGFEVMRCTKCMFRFPFLAHAHQAFAVVKSW